MASSNDLLPILLLPQHITVKPSQLLLLEGIQKVLNDGYRKTHGQHPEIFGDSFLRLADPAHLADTIGVDGFTVVLLRLVPNRFRTRRLVEVVATGSAKDFGDGNIEEYAQWAKSTTGKQWKAKARIQTNDPIETPKERRPVNKYEITAFAVAPINQTGGLGARVLKEMEWLIESENGIMRLRHAYSADAPLVQGIEILGENGDSSPVQGIDLVKFREMATSLRPVDLKMQPQPIAKLVLIAIRELGTETYYQRRGYKTLWSGTVPLGMYDCRKECTMVYMEKTT